VSTSLKRVSVMLREDQYESLAAMELNLSGLLRDLIDDHLSEHKIVLSVEQETRDLYDLVISNTGNSDQDLEKYLKVAIKELLKHKIDYMVKLHQGL
jgi:hypothetical protein